MPSFKNGTILFSSILVLIVIATYVYRSEAVSAVKLNELEQNAETTAALDAALTYTYRLWESVGFTAEYKISEPGILKMTDNDVKFHHLANLVPGYTGADEATATYSFKALKPGRTTLTIKELYRGKLKVEKSFKITVNPSQIKILPKFGVNLKDF